ncbi:MULTISPECIES: TetR/AcrR family transcriptional regulator [unclassified Corynebacterium]|uniref:TetR/AcrR family transcriptional regulator n=1 Tax=unclassified Corynebacterium TaxID=2624378 RepID=UPI0029CAA2BC|nr:MULTISPECIES: TetR/AcrR family transcriptional regulator [unclassified Corynebacterium]WPF66348.1 TetR/AcrR family transcriptional regulator [Corynebacterium sp. 22KM0430]WPF68838.1 TetR/AcrR family transcriptional regulator [Corynebacterium sp. 21KM1197]
MVTSVAVAQTKHTDIEENILSAARECFMESGVQKTTMVAVARRAEVSRPTVYSYFGSVDNLARKVLTREMVGLLDAAYPLPRDVDGLCAALVEVGLLARRNEFLAQVLGKSPELLLTYQFQRLGESQEILIRFIKNTVARIQGTDPAMRGGDPKVIATQVFMVVQSLVLSAEAMSTGVPSEEEWAVELTAMLKGYLCQ